MRKNRIVILIILSFIEILFFSCTNKNNIKTNTSNKIAENDLIYTRVTDTVLLKIFNNNVEKANEESLFFEYYKINKEFENVALNDDLLIVIGNHYGNLILNEFGKPKLSDFKILEQNKFKIVKNIKFSYTILENNFAQGVPAYPSFGKIVLLYNNNTGILTFIYCDNFIFDNRIEVIQSIRDRIITNFYEYDTDINQYILEESNFIEN